jgi:hypothetical protein
MHGQNRKVRGDLWLRLWSCSRRPVNQRSAQLHHDSIPHDPHAIDRGIVKLPELRQRHERAAWEVLREL